jgi:hypothetical protein
VLDKVVDWIRNAAKAVIGAGKRAVQAVVAWWRVRKPFKTDDGESHQLGTRGEGRTAVVTVRSDEVTYRDYLDKTDPGKNADKKKALASAKDIYKDIEKLKSSQKNLDQGVMTKKFSDLLDKLAEQTMILMSGDELPESTPPVYGGLSAGNYATSVSVVILTAKGTGGSPAAEGAVASSNDWKVLATRRETPTSRKRFYVLGHLISQWMHGPGDKPQNIAPQSESGNQTFNHAVERELNKNIGTKGSGAMKGGNRMGFRYEVTAIYGGRKNPSDFKSDWKNDPEDVRQKKLAIVDAEARVPRLFRFWYQVVYEKGKTIINGKKTTPPDSLNDIRQDADKYHIG